MAFQMNFSKEELSGAPPVPAAWYTVQFKQFRPKAAKNGESVSLNAELAIVSPVEYENRRIFVGMNTKMAFMWPDFVHAAGLEMEEVQDADAGTEKANYTLPGVFENADTAPDKPETWKYLGPLTNKTLEVELCETEYQGRKRNEVRQFKCAVAGCTDKHSTNLIKN